MVACAALCTSNFHSKHLQVKPMLFGRNNVIPLDYLLLSPSPILARNVFWTEVAMSVICFFLFYFLVTCMMPF